MDPAIARHATAGADVTPIMEGVSFSDSDRLFVAKQCSISDPGMETISPERLTEAQRVALRMFMERMTAKEIGLRLGISPKAVELRLKGARDTLGVTTSAEAARILAAHEEGTFRNTLGGATEVADIAPDGLSGSDDAEGTIETLPDPRSETAPPNGADRGARWIRDIDWPIRSQRRTENDLNLTQRLLWPLLIIIGTLIGLGILINSIATLSQVALNLFGPR